MVQRVGAAGVVVGQRGVVVVVLVALQLGRRYFALGPARDSAGAAVRARVMVVVVFAQQRAVAQRELVPGYQLPAARVAPEALHVVHLSLGPHHELGPVEAQVALITFGAEQSVTHAHTHDGHSLWENRDELLSALRPRVICTTATRHFDRPVFGDRNYSRGPSTAPYSPDSSALVALFGFRENKNSP